MTHPIYNDRLGAHLAGSHCSTPIPYTKLHPALPRISHRPYKWENPPGVFWNGGEIWWNLNYSTGVGGFLTMKIETLNNMTYCSSFQFWSSSDFEINEMIHIAPCHLKTHYVISRDFSRYSSHPNSISPKLASPHVQSNWISIGSHDESGPALFLVTYTKGSK